MKFEFINDLDEYFCETYANYDRLCVLPGYKMPKMQDTRIDDFGRKYSYTLPAKTMNLAGQENKAELLAALKEKIMDKSFSFSFRPLTFWGKISDFFSKTAFRKYLKVIAARYHTTPEALGDGLAVDAGIWKRILKGSFYPSKNMVFSIALVGQFTLPETQDLLAICGYEFTYEEEKDVVVSYLLTKRIFNPTMVQAALEEYKLGNLFIKA